MNKTGIIDENEKMCEFLDIFIHLSEESRLVCEKAIELLGKLALTNYNFSAFSVFDNTLNGRDLEKNSWLISIFDSITEKTFFIEIKKVENDYVGEIYERNDNNEKINVII